MADTTTGQASRDTQDADDAATTTQSEQESDAILGTIIRAIDPDHGDQDDE